LPQERQTARLAFLALSPMAPYESPSALIAMLDDMSLGLHGERGEL
jgi:hypothetical protein